MATNNHLIVSQSYFNDVEHFPFQIINSAFTNITYESVGNLLDLRHQTLTPLLIQDVTFDNVNSNGVFIGAADKQQTHNPLNVQVN